MAAGFILSIVVLPELRPRSPALVPGFFIGDPVTSCRSKRPHPALYAACWYPVVAGVSNTAGKRASDRTLIGATATSVAIRGAGVTTRAAFFRNIRFASALNARPASCAPYRPRWWTTSRRIEGTSACFGMSPTIKPCPSGATIARQRAKMAASAMPLGDGVGAGQEFLSRAPSTALSTQFAASGNFGGGV